MCSLSTRTIVYKGLLIADQMDKFYKDLTDPDFETAIAMIHSRFSTNTFPSWSRAHPYRYICHNGEINTLRGNRNWMRARQYQFASQRVRRRHEEGAAGDLAKAAATRRASTTRSKLLVQTGRSLPHAVMMMIPEAWQEHEAMTDEKRAFYEYHACLMEPWDGPASIAFTDGTLVGAVLDRNGLRPSRYYVTKDDIVVMASEVGVLDIPPEDIVQKNRLEPGRMFLVDTAQGRIIADEQLKDGMAKRKPYRKWLKENLLHLDELPEPDASRLPVELDNDTLLVRQRAHGYTREDIRLVVRPMAQNGEEAIGSMGNDTPLAVLSERPQLVFNYFRQQFAQVTNPPVDSLRENLVMSMRTTLGAEQNLFDETPEHCHQLQLENPIITNAELRAIKDLDYRGLRTKTLDAVFPVEQHGAGLRDALESLCKSAEQAIDDGYSILVLSDRKHDNKLAPIPSLLATSAVHHHLIRAGKRTRCGIVVESGEPREIQHFCLLLGYGACAINPYLVFEIIYSQSQQELLRKLEPRSRDQELLEGVGQGHLEGRCPRWASPRCRAIAARRSSRRSASRAASRCRLQSTVTH